MSEGRLSTLDLLDRLISFDTVSDRSNLPMLAWIEDYLRPLGFTCARIPDPTGLKANLVASIGPLAQPGYILSGHMDVVPVEGQRWSSDPFRMRVEAGRAYGRGSCDMKGFLACCLSLAPALAGMRLMKPVHLAFSYDEEVGCIGAKDLAAWVLATHGPQEACFVGEPTGMDVVIGHKGNHTLRVNITGEAAHSSLAPLHVSAIDIAMNLLARIREIGAVLQSSGPSDPLFDVPHCTTSVGTIRGGEASNIVAQNCSFDVEFRTLASVDPAALVREIETYAREELEPQMRSLSPGSSIQFVEMLSYPGLDTAEDAGVTTFAKRLAMRNGHRKVAYGTEAALFVRLAQTPTVVIGPGSIQQAHQPDEFIELAELQRCSEFLDRLAMEACRGPA
jgi:acetylornithine deacetylase